LIQSFGYENLDIKKTGWHVEQTLAKNLNPFLATFSLFKKIRLKKREIFFDEETR
jgi:hypothetical protein